MTVSWTRVLIDGAALCSTAGAVILGSLAYEPRMWLGDAPPPVRAVAPPLSPEERRARNVTGLLLLAAMILTCWWAGSNLVTRQGDALSFAGAFVHFLGVFFVFNLFDLLVVDWLVLLVIRPAFLRRLWSFPGLTYEETVGGYRYHFIGFLKGLGIITVLALLAATITVGAAAI